MNTQEIPEYRDIDLARHILRLMTYFAVSAVVVNWLWVIFAVFKRMQIPDDRYDFYDQGSELMLITGMILIPFVIGVIIPGLMSALMLRRESPHAKPGDRKLSNISIGMMLSGIVALLINQWAI